MSPTQVRAGALPANVAQQYNAAQQRAQKIGWTPRVARVLAAPVQRNYEYLGQRVALQQDATGKDRVTALGRDRFLDRGRERGGRGIAD